MTLRVAAVQHDIVWEKPSENFRRLSPQIEHAVGGGARLVVLSEMFSTGFTMNSAECAESLEGPSYEFLVEHSTMHGIWISGSVPTRWDDQIAYNTLVLAGPDGNVLRYKKIHPFSYSKEPENYGAGTEFLQTEIEDVRISFFVCYDLRFANEFWELAESTDLFVVPANWPGHRRAHWKNLLQARAIENQSYVLGVNRVGEGDGLGYLGDSSLIDPWGEIMFSAASAETVLLADVDEQVVANTRKSFPVLQDRRIGETGLR